MPSKDLEKVFQQREERAKELRKKFFDYLDNIFDFTFPFNVNNILSFLDIKIEEFSGPKDLISIHKDVFSADILGHSLDTYGYSFWSKDNKPVMKINENLDFKSKNFKMAHELFHIFTFRKEKYSNPFINKEIYKPEDISSDAFATDLICPRNLLYWLSKSNSFIAILNFFKIPIFNLIKQLFLIDESSSLDMYIFAENDIALYFFQRANISKQEISSINLSQINFKKYILNKKQILAKIFSERHDNLFVSIDKYPEKRFLKSVGIFDDIKKQKDQFYSFCLSDHSRIKSKEINNSGYFFGALHNLTYELEFNQSSGLISIFYFLPDKNKVLYKLWNNDLKCIFEPLNYDELLLLLDLKIDNEINEKISSVLTINKLKKYWINQYLSNTIYHGLIDIY